MSFDSNRIRVLSEVVSLDAWHGPFDHGKDSVSVAVEVSFREGRLGGDDSAFPFTFKVGMKRARLTVRLEHPLEIIKSSVARNVPTTEIEHTRLRTIRDTLSAKVEAGGKVGLGDFHAALTGKVNSGRESKREDELRVVQTLPLILVASEPRGSQEYSWVLEPTYLPILEGQPWDPVKYPRLSARYDAASIKRIEPIISANLTCALDDLRIDDIRPKDPGLGDKLLGRLTTDTRTIAAQQHLSTILRNANLEPGRMDNRFASLLIASAIASVEQRHG